MVSDTSIVRARRPLFITGMERSGTTLLAAMLSEHSAICRLVPPFVANLFSSWPEGVADPEQLESFLDDLYGRTRFGHSPVPRDALRARLRPLLPLAFRDLAAEVVATHSTHQGKADFVYWGDKTPWLVRVLHARKAQFDRVLGDYRLVTIVRDGRAVLSSVLRAQATSGRNFRTDVFYLAAQWRKAATLETLFSEQGQHFQVRYEQLITRPVETLQVVCRFLDLPYEPGMLEYQRRGPTSSIHRLLSAPPRPDRMEAWHAEGDGRRLRVFDLLARSELRRAGYPPLPPAIRRGWAVALWETTAYWLDTRVRARLRKALERGRPRSGRPVSTPPATLPAAPHGRRR